MTLEKRATGLLGALLGVSTWWDERAQDGMAWALLGGPYTVPGGVYTLQGMSIPGDGSTYSFDKC